MFKVILILMILGVGGYAAVNAWLYPDVFKPYTSLFNLTALVLALALFSKAAYEMYTGDIEWKGRVWKALKKWYIEEAYKP